MNGPRGLRLVVLAAVMLFCLTGCRSWGGAESVEALVDEYAAVMQREDAFEQYPMVCAPFTPKDVMQEVKDPESGKKYSIGRASPDLPPKVILQPTIGSNGCPA